MIETTITDIFSEENVFFSMKHVIRKNASPGLSDITADVFSEYWVKNGGNILSAIYDEKYKPNDVLRVPIQKDAITKQKRMLEIPTLVDRVILYAIAVKLEPEFRKDFSAKSYGFIAGRGQRDALIQCTEYINNGYSAVAQIDIKSFFDNVNHRKLRDKLELTLKDEKIHRLIQTYLRQRVVDPFRKITYIKHRGIGQGSPLSPLLANIVLDDVDKFCEGLDLKYVRYADDIMVFCNNERKAETAIKWIQAFVEKHLSLRLNSEKTHVLEPEKVNFLGYSYQKTGNEYHLKVSDKAVRNLHNNMISAVRKCNQDNTEWFNRIGAFNRGWLNYFKYADYEQLRQIVNSAEDELVYEIYQAVRVNNVSRTHQQDLAALQNSSSFITMNEWLMHITDSRFLL